jgi:hypothetical protein
VNFLHDFYVLFAVLGKIFYAFRSTGGKKWYFLAELEIDLEL